MRKPLRFLILQYVLCVVGLVFLYRVDWKIPTGFMLFMLGESIDNEYKAHANNLFIMDKILNYIKGIMK